MDNNDKIYRDLLKSKCFTENFLRISQSEYSTLNEKMVIFKEILKKAVLINYLHLNLYDGDLKQILLVTRYYQQSYLNLEKNAQNLKQKDLTEYDKNYKMID